MNKPTVSRIVSTLSTLSVALLGLALAAPAQAQTTMQVNVPFGFESGTSHFEPGIYRIHLGSSSPVVRIEGDKSSAFQMAVPGESGRVSDTGKVVFHRYGSHYILKEIWAAGSSSCMRTPTSKAEKQLELAQAKSNPGKQEPEYLALVASR